MKKTIRIEGMSCGHCTARVAKALDALEGISSVSVDLDSGTAVVEAADTVTDEAIIEAVDDAGYDVLRIE